MSEYIQYIISMKSGAKFCVKIKSFEIFAGEIYDMAKQNPQTGLFIDEGLVININDISAIYPKEAEDKLKEKINGQTAN